MKICLITNTLVSYNPRLLKEADTLHENGHDVRVISVSNNSERAEADENGVNEVLLKTIAQFK